VQKLQQSGGAVTTELTKLTGVSLSPLLGISAVGAWAWNGTPAEMRERLPWHQQPWFWGTGLVLAAVLFLADKVPLVRTLGKNARLFVSKASGVLAAAVMLQSFASAASGPAQKVIALASDLVIPTALAASPEGGAGPGVVHGFAFAGMLLVGLIIACAVWLLGHAIEVLVLLSPFAPLDAVLRTSRLAVLVLLVGAALLSPALGAALAGVVILFSLLMAGWTFRLMVFGSVISWDFLSFSRVAPGPDGRVRAFATSVPGVPKRTWGTLERSESGHRFSWRPCLVLPTRTRPMPKVAAVGIGVLSPVILGTADLHGRELARVPPRYRGSHTAVATALGGLPIVDVPLVRGLKAAWAFLRGTEAAGASTAS
jgi:hypothetical protein